MGRLVGFGNVVVAPIAIGNVAVGYVAIGLSVAVGPIAIGINSLGFLLAVGLNAAGFVDLAAVNGIGALTFAGVNGFGALGGAGVNWVDSPIVSAAFAMAEGAAAVALRDGTARVGRLLFEKPEEDARVLVSGITEDGLSLRGGKRLSFGESIGPEQRRALREAVAASRYPLAEVRIQRVEHAREADRYRQAPEVDRTFEIVSARLVEVPRWYAPMFHRSLLVGAALCALVTALAFLLR